VLAEESGSLEEQRVNTNDATGPFHIWVGSIRYNCAWVTREGSKGMNPARFNEYALNTSLMIVLIGMLVDIYELGTMIALLGVNVMQNLFGNMMELHNQTSKRTDWTLFIYGCIAGIVLWIVIVPQSLPSRGPGRNPCG